MKKCPFCAEEIQDEAILCRFCGRELGETPLPSIKEASVDVLEKEPPELWKQGLKFGLIITVLNAISILFNVRSPIERAGQLGSLPVLLIVYTLLGMVLVWLWRNARIIFWLLIAAIPLTVVIVVIAFFGPELGTLNQLLSREPTSAPQSSNIPEYRPTATQFRPRPTNTPSTSNRDCFMGICDEDNSQSSRCLSPEMVTAQDRGKIVTVCGMVVGEGERNCPTCPYGQYYYLTLKGGFDIISYDWNFLSSMVGMCLMISDKVELLAGKPIFVFGSAEGYAGSKCVRLGDGTMECSEGDYFRAHYGCK